MIMAIFGLFLPGLGEWDRSLDLINTARRLNPYLSGQYYIPACLDFYRRGEFDGAFEASLRINTPGLLWEPLIRAAILGELGRIDEARPYVQSLFRLQPRFTDSGHNVVRRLLFSQQNVDMLYNGLLQAGLPNHGSLRLVGSSNAN